MIRYVKTEKAPQPVGPYSQATVFRDVIYVSGQIPIVPETGEKCLGSIEEQTEQVLKNLKAIIEEAGSSMSRVLKVTVYISDISLWARMNAVYERFFPEPAPARSAVPTRDLPFGFKIEIDAIAAIGESADFRA